MVIVKLRHLKKYLFPYRGLGYSWAEYLTGNCGKAIHAEMKTTEVGKDKGFSLFYFGFGYAWIKRATLVLTIAQ